MRNFRRSAIPAVAMVSLAAGVASAQEFCPDHPGSPVLLTPGSATCAHDATTGDTAITLTNESIIEWAELDVPGGSTTSFDFLGGTPNPSVVNTVTGNGTNNIDGMLTSNGRVVMVSPNAETRVNGAIMAASFTGVSLQPDDLGELLTGGSTTFGFGGGGREWFSVRGGSIIATDGDVVLGGDNVTAASGSQISAPNGAVRIVSAQRFALSGSGTQRITESGPPASGVLNTGRLEGQDVEIKSTSDINNGGTIEAGGGFGRIYLKVGPGGTVFNEGTGTLSGILQITGNFDDVGITIGPDDGDAAIAASNSTINLPDLESPRGEKTRGRVINQVGGAAGSAEVARESRRQRSTSTASGGRKMLNRKSGFFGLVGRGQGKPSGR